MLWLHGDSQVKLSMPTCCVAQVEPVGIISLADVVVQRYRHHTRKRTFQLSHPQRRTVFLDCETNDELRQWVTMIERVSVGPVNPPPTVGVYYARLGLEPGCRSIEIKKAFRKLALVHHPDKGGDKEFFQKITEAYEICVSVQVRRSVGRSFLFACMRTSR